MADEKTIVKDPEGESKPLAPQAEIDAAVEKAHIVEETVVRPSSPPANPAPPPPVPSVFPPPPPLATKPQEPLKTSPALPNSPLLEERAPLPPPPPPPPAPPLIAEDSEKERVALAQILKEVRIPERRRAPGQSHEHSESRIFDTMPGVTIPPIPRTTPLPEAAPPPPPKPVPVPAIKKIPSAAQVVPTEKSPPQQGEAPAAKQDEPAAPSLPAPPLARFASSIVMPLRTLKNDLQEIVRTKKISLVRAAALEQEKRGRADAPAESTRPKSHRTSGILFAAALLVALGGASIFGVYIITQQRSGVPPPDPDTSILFAESTIPLPLGNTSPFDLKQLLAQAREGGSATLGAITRIVPTISEMSAENAPLERSVTLEEFLEALGTRTSPDLIRALSNEFFFGIHTVDENAPLFVIPVISYEHAFAGMLEWEQTMNADLSPAFMPLPEQILGSTGLPEKRRFEDVIMRNYDVRALKNDNGGIELYYSFPTRSLLVIGESPYSFGEILDRLRAERKL